MSDFFITGTNTGVGKSTIASVLLRSANQAGLKTIGLKPVACGDVTPSATGELQNDDALLLQQASSVRLTYQQINPYLFSRPVSPHIAAASEDCRLRADEIADRCSAVLQQYPHDLSLIEGAGGWLVPINQDETMADVAQRLELPVILVVGLTLGCLNHAFLTAQVIRDQGLSLVAWVGVETRGFEALPENVTTLQRHLSAPCLGILPFEDDLVLEALTGKLDVSPLLNSC